MPSRDLGFPVFDADNHLYETRDALTRYLPEQYRGAIDYVPGPSAAAGIVWRALRPSSPETQPVVGSAEAMTLGGLSGAVVADPLMDGPLGDA